MARDNERSRLFTRRAVMLCGAKAGLFSLLAGRLYYLQILQGDKFRTLAEENRVNLRLLEPRRGQILDRAGTPLAVNQQNYRLVLSREQAGDLEELLGNLQRLTAIDDFDRKRIERDLKNARNLNTVLVRDNLTWDQVAAVSLHMVDLPGTDIEAGEVRTYPYGETLSHLIGYVGAAGPQEMDDIDPEHMLSGFKIGKNAVEKKYDYVLRGDPGSVQLEVNARGRVVRELSRNEPRPGKDLVLTIDAGLQQSVQKRLSEEQSAAAVVMDVHNGAVYALVSHPSYDPNLFTHGISKQDWDRLNTDEHTPLLNKAVDGVYAPGSTFKVVTALAALDAGLLDPDDQVFCPGHLDLGNHRFHCWKKGGHGHVNFVRAMAGSCDTYFYELGRRVGIDRIQNMAKRLGLGEKTGIDLPHERTGLVPGRAWKKAVRNAAWQQGETLITAIGQGYLLASPLQLAVMTARIVNGGKQVRPSLVKQGEYGSETRRAWPPLNFDPDALDLVQQAMSAVVNETIGTAYGARIVNEAMAMAGKTGTSQVRRISKAEREEGIAPNEDRPWKERDHALFIGYAPVGDPRYAAAVIVEHGGSGAHTAAPIVRDILAECQKRNVAGG